MREAMEVGSELTDLGDGLGVEVHLDGRRSLPELTAVLRAVCDAAEDRSAPTVVLIRLVGTGQCPREWPGAVGVQDVSRWERALRRMEGLAAMVIAVATGTVAGPALDVLLTADFRIAGRDLELLPPVNDGQFWPGMAVYRLVQHLGLARARQIVLWGDEMSAARAREVGLVDQVVEHPAEAAATATVLMGRIADAELSVRRRLLSEATSATYENALGVHLAACDRELRRLGRIAGGSDDAPEVRR